MLRRRVLHAVPLFTLATLAAACNFPGGETLEATSTATSTPRAAQPASTQTPIPATSTPAPPTATIVHLTRPNEEAPSRYLFLTDAVSASSADVRGAKGGDDFSANRFERPFAADGMVYQPEIDLTGAEVAFDEDWYYFTLNLQGSVDATRETGGNFAIEIDADVDGRGDWLILAARPLAEAYTTDGVQIWRDSNNDVGGERPLQPDSPGSGDGYDELLFDQGRGADPDAAWARRNPEQESSVQIAVRRAALEGDSAFLWSAWADQGLADPQQFEYNDRFSFSQAGSPLPSSPEYPLQALAEVDNTCRMYFGFTPTGNEPGICELFGTIQNCTPHRMLALPGDIFFDGQETAGGTYIRKAMPGAYSFYDQDDLDNNQHPLVLTATLRPGGLIQVTMTGLGDTYACK